MPRFEGVKYTVSFPECGTPYAHLILQGKRKKDCEERLRDCWKSKLNSLAGFESTELFESGIGW